MYVFVISIGKVHKTPYVTHRYAICVSTYYLYVLLIYYFIIILTTCIT